MASSSKLLLQDTWNGKLPEVICIHGFLANIVGESLSFPRIRKVAQRNIFFILLLILDGVISIVPLINTPALTSMLSYVNFAPPYAFGFDVGSVLMLQSFSFLNQMLILLFSPPIGQNLTFVLCLILPSVFIFFFVRELAKSEHVALVFGILFGTILDPLSFFLMSGGSLGLLMSLSFAFFSGYLVLRGTRSEKGKTRIFIIPAGIVFGLAGSTVFPTSSYITAPFVLLIVFYSLSLSDLDFRAKLKDLFSFLVAFAATMSANLIPNFIYAREVLLGSDQYVSSNVRTYVLSVIQYEFKPYGLVNSIFPFSQGSFSAWDFLTIVLLLSGLLTIWVPVGKKRILYFGAFFEYISVSIFIFELKVGALFWLYSEFRFLYTLDYPLFFMFIQLQALVILGVAFVDIFRKYFIIRLNLSTDLRTLHAANHIDINVVVVLAIFILLVLSNSASYLGQSNALLTSKSIQKGEQSYNSFVPPYYEELHVWFEQQNTHPTGQMLFLPYSYNELNYARGFIPTGFLWNMPIPLPPTTSFYNISLYEHVLDSLKSSNVSTFSDYLSICGVQFVIVAIDYRTLVIDPFEPLVMNTSLVVNALRSSSFSVSFSDSHFIVFENLKFFQAEDKLVSFSSDASLPNSGTPTSQTLINAANLTNAAVWPAGRLGPSNDSLTFFTPPNSSIPYSILSFFASFNTSISDSIFTSNLLQIGFATSKSQDATLGVSILFYNNSSPGFWSESERYYLPAVTNNTLDYYNYYASIPNGTASFNVAFVLSGNATQNNSASLAALHLRLLTIQNVVSTSPIEQSYIVSMFESVVPGFSDTLPLLYPFNSNIQNNSAITHQVYTISLDKSFYSSGQIELNLDKVYSEDPQLTGMTDSYLVGIENNASLRTHLNISTSSSNSWVNFDTNGLAVLNLSLYKNGNITIESNNTHNIAYLGIFMVFSNANSSSNSTNIVIQLPKGYLNLINSNGKLQLVWNVSIKPIPIYYYIVGDVPIMAVALYYVLRLRGVLK